MTNYDQRHGGAFDRGAADAYYRRAFRPHMFVGGTYSSTEILEHQMRADEIEAYRAGYEDQVASGVFKDWG